jgi:hypothetical protein
VYSNRYWFEVRAEAHTTALKVSRRLRVISMSGLGVRRFAPIARVLPWRLCELVRLFDADACAGFTRRNLEAVLQPGLAVALGL